MNEIEKYLNNVYVTYEESMKNKYDEWQKTKPLIDFNQWASTYQPRWFSQFEELK